MLTGSRQSPGLGDCDTAYTHSPPNTRTTTPTTAIPILATNPNLPSHTARRPAARPGPTTIDHGRAVDARHRTGVASPIEVGAARSRGKAFTPLTSVNRPNP
ncbi:hypothetical protein GCM10010492_56500 [Saccharothrix mutabilis subsp. mutabilis]|uniref:Uncharacterized protein n=1 Tax=Saccharothrix mutabilis subsp. mutabilis TaxID=66855 RepID=A0ABN0UFZ7_9PSEU